ncbi:acetylornithine deacetylase [Variovorax sp. YR752]|uniref:acetylornithine deacetylase n=1 Tax=Variovorax sp. YR752 TaxID=1884383 RepID=UPI000BCAAA41|nr:acetylornithine deacetylase [Variovorax sp. YR752]SOE06207.1 acetylornithine deacetylase [Variovorax sp. YR752]
MADSMERSPSPETVQWLRQLLGFATVSGSASNLDLLALAGDALAQIGFRTRLTHSPDRQRANLFASLGEGSGGLLLSGHTDVVPVDGQHWHRPPFELSEDTQRFYGRGACDMKGFLAAVLATVARLDSSVIDTPLHIALTYDEEIGCIGVRQLLQDLREAGIHPSACIVGEPTGMQLVRAHKGRHAFRCAVRGRAAHSSLAGTVANAAEAAGRLVWEVAQQAQALQRDRDEGFYVPFSTMATCRFSAGHASNVIPEEAQFDFDLRYLPSIDPEAAVAPLHRLAAELETELRQRTPEARIAIERRTAVPALAPDARSDALAAKILGAGAVSGAHVAYTTEGGLYQAAGIPTVVCGPGDIAQAHTADEFILKAQLAECESLLAILLTRRCGDENRQDST